MKVLISVFFSCIILSGIGSYNVKATTYDGVAKLPITHDNKNQVELGVPVKIKLTVREKNSNILEFDSNVSLIKNIETLSGSISPYIRITNLDTNEVVYSDFNGINQANKHVIKIKQAYPSTKSVKLDSGKYEVYYEYQIIKKTNKKDYSFSIGKSGGIPIRIK
jgi:hypothetical protein